MRQQLTRACVAAVTLTAATYAGATFVGASPADAAACSTADGVTVVVDFHGLGGGLQQVCDADGGGEYANALFTQNGFELTYVQKQPGFVCRIDAKPADDPCVNTPPADAYWGLWWSDGSNGKWSYSTLGAGSLKIPEGGAVAFSWNSGSGQDKPGVSPPAHAEDAPSPTPSPSASPTGGGNGDGNGGGNNGGGNNSGGGATSTPTPEPTAPASTAPTDAESATPTPTEATTEPDETEEPSPTESTTPTDEASPTPLVAESEPTASPPAADEDGLPGWLAPTVVALLFAAAAAVAVVRRRRNLADTPRP